jgi:hypothetical protein
MLAVDWSGDTGAVTKPAAATYFALAVVAFDEEEIAALLAQLRKDQRLPERFEYHFSEGPTKTDRIFKQWPHRPNRPRGMGSHQCDGIQIADMLAGAARHRVAGKTPDYLAPLTAKVSLKEAK